MGSRCRVNNALLATGSLSIAGGLLFDLGWPYTATACVVVAFMSLMATLAIWEQSS